MELVIVWAVGLCVGSFLNVVIYRIPNGLSIIAPSSRCCSCDTPIKYRHNIPLLSWVLLGGKSACCGEKISIRYPLVELFTSAIFLVIFINDGYGIASFVTSVTFSLFFALAVIDYYHHEIPDSVSLSLLSIAFFHRDLEGSFLDASIVMGIMAMLRFYVSYVLKKEAMGEGDIIIGGAMGALAGIWPAFFAVFVAAFIALPFALYAKGQNIKTPFVPFLFIGTFTVYLFPESVKMFFG